MYILGAATLLTKARIIRDKQAETIIDSIFCMWLADGPGAPKRFLSDNGIEFSNFAFQEMCELINVVECKMPVESPWSNGLCEQNHAVVDSMVKQDGNV